MIQENGALVEFVRDAVQSNFKSAQAGRPIYEERDFVRITTPGDTKTTIYRPATTQDKERFSKAWSAYEKGLEAVTEGTPMAQWPQVSQAQVKELAHVNVRTVEQLASVSDSSIQHMGPGYMQLRTRARQYLESASKDANDTAQARENEKLRERLELLEEQNKALKAEVAAAKDGEQKRGPGRPRKTDSDE